MKRVSIYGLKSSKKDEKALMKRVNDFLAGHQRTTSKAKQPSFLAGFAPFTIKHFYWNLHKGIGTYFQIYPNEDFHSAFFFPDHKDCGWLMFVNIKVEQFGGVVTNKAKEFIEETLRAPGFEGVLLRETDNPGRLARDGNPKSDSSGSKPEPDIVI